MSWICCGRPLISVLKRCNHSANCRYFTSVLQLTQKRNLSLSVARMCTPKNFIFEPVMAGGVTALQVGAPSPDMLRESALVFQKATQSLMQDSNMWELFQYGAPQGSLGFREQLAAFLSKGYNSPVNSDRLFMTPGATTGLHFVCSLLMPPCSTVFIEDPTYFLALNMFRDDFGYNIVPVSTDSLGTNIDDLENLVADYARKNDFTPTEKYPFRALVYVVTTFNNPFGSSLPQDRCKRLVEIARKYDLLVVADDVYNLLNYNYERDPPARLLTYDEATDPGYKGGNVLSNGTFSKIFSPGMRCGWIEAPDKIIKKLTSSSTIVSSGGMSQTVGAVMAHAMALGGVQQQLSSIRDTNAKRMTAACESLRENLPDSCSFYEPEGGYFIWIRLPEGAKTSKVLEMCKAQHKITFVPGNMCSPSGQYENCLRLSIAYYEEDVLRSSMKKVAMVIREYLKSLST